MDSKKKILFLIIICLIVFSIGLLIFLNISKKNKSIDNSISNIDNNDNVEENVVKEVSENKVIYDITYCTQLYFSTLNMLWTDLSDMRITGGEETITADGKYEFNEFYAKQLLEILSPEYVESKQITKDNVKEKFSYFEQEKNIINNAYQYDINDYVRLFIINGYNITTTGANKKDFKIMLIIDYKSNAFEVYPEDYVVEENFDKIKVGEKINNLDNIESIQLNKYNKVASKNPSNEKIAEDYFYLYRFNMKYDQEAAYEMLDEEYREKRFGSLDNYVKYIKENFHDLMSGLVGYEYKEQDEYQQYTDQDKNGYYYIFRKNKNNMTYNLILDTYTIDLPEFIKKYDSAKTEEKVVMNMQKFIDALNVQDYNYAYNHLADALKEKSFKNVDSFKEYVANNWYKKTEIGVSDFSSSANSYSFTLKMYNKEQNDNEIISKKVIMQITEKRDFKIVFNVE